MLRREGILAGVEQEQQQRQRPRAVADERRPVFDGHILTVTIIKRHLCCRSYAVFLLPPSSSSSCGCLLSLHWNLCSQLARTER